jgi:molybdate transport system substrate-binding protein
MRRATPKVCAVVLVLSLAAAACSGDSSPSASAATGASSAGEPTELVVFAASSLTAAFDEIGAAFQAPNSGVTVTFNTGPSDSLAGQIQSEGTADVFASASGTWMDAVDKDPGVTDRTDFAKNRLVLVTPADNPAGIRSLDDIAQPDVQLVLAAEGVPVGDYARDMLDNAGIADDALANVVSNEEDAASVVAKITAGEADAAVVYESDVSAAAGNELTAIEIPEDVNVIATYPIAVVSGSAHAELATAFVEAVTGAEGQATLQRYGFEPIS